MKAKCINRWLIAIVLFSLVLGSNVFANNIQITGKPFMYNKNTTDGSLYISFPVQWENSWKVNKPNNWDAAWVFIKYREGGNPWQPVYIDTDNSKHSCSAYGDDNSKVKTTIKVGTSIVRAENDTSEKGVGAFIYRSENGKGAIKFDSVNLKWNYKAQGLDNEAIISLRVFAVEMVYIPQEGYLLGNTGWTNNTLKIQPDSALVSNFYDITTPGPGTWNVFGNAIGDNIVKNNSAVAAWPGVSKDIKSPGPTNGRWYLTESKNGVKAYSEIQWYTAWQNLLYPFARSWDGSIQWSSAGYYGERAQVYGNTDGWHTIRLRMPVAYKASSMYFGWSNSYAITGFFGRASKDSVNWVNITAESSGISYGASAMHRIPIESSKMDAYQWYEFNMFTNTYIILGAWGLADETEGGFPENAYYYGSHKPYQGQKPLKYLITGDNNATADSNFPNGYEAFYIMKHELSQHAYVDFLNTLTESQQEYLVYAGKPSATDASSNPRCFSYGRNWVRLREKAAGSPAIYGCWVEGETQDPWSQEKNAGNVAMNGLDWYCVSSYLCWAGLRPLTELEYEKSCRGTANRVQDEYAWGTSSTIPVTASPSNKNLSNELANPSNANYIPQTSGSNVVYYPMRVGSLATSTSTRTDAGASFYGVLNLSDNVSEIYVNISTLPGRQYSGEHGTGSLDGNGASQILNWPNVYTAEGTGIRGIYSNANPEVANRNNAERVISRTVGSSAVGVNQYIGCRGGRTAPK